MPRTKLSPCPRLNLYAIIVLHDRMLSGKESKEELMRETLQAPPAGRAKYATTQPALTTRLVIARKSAMNPPTGEFAFIDWLRQQTPADPRVLLGPGDDAAALRLGVDTPCLVTTDMLLDGSCFILAEAGPRLVGRKAMAVNLSDIAAMAGRPVAAVVSVGLPRDGGRALASELYTGLREMADAFETAIIGGDTNSWNGPLVISVTVLGEAAERGAVRRSGARPGDRLVVTGPLGGSIQGKHLTFTPRVREALQLHALADLHAMIDISDGLGADVNHLCTESRCGAVLRAEAIPITHAAKRMDDERSPLEHALGDGEDFELVFAVSPEDAHRLIDLQPIAGITLTHIGEVVDSGLWLEQDGERRTLDPVGYEHPLR
jgi:thiamine-monophosphate kinase